jgi:tetratricopeptide (TPR) repeat protein
VVKGVLYRIGGRSNYPQAGGTRPNNLAGLYRAQGRYSEAEPLYQRALAIAEHRLGPDHPYVAAILNNLVGLYEAQGRHSEAEPLYQRILAIAKGSATNSCATLFF